MTRCDHCGEREAVIHLTQVVDDTISTLHLCEQCAAEKGVDTGTPVSKFPLGEFLASLGKAVPAAAADAEAACPGCGASLADFRRTGRLGCAACYGAFEAHLRDLLRRLHGTTEHAGERYRGSAAATAPVAEEAAPAGLADLRERLRRAVEAERFEEAARLRDAIRGLE